MSFITDEPNEQETAFIFPESARITPEQWAEIERQDALHTNPPTGHNLTEERDIRCTIPVKRQSCDCGWRGPWYPIRSMN